jgi:flagellar hook-associated protein 3 FlgL
MRISSSEFLLGSLNELLNQESNVNQLNQEIATGQTMLDATSDPAGAGLAVEVASQIDRLNYDSKNAESGAQSIESGLNALQQVTNVIDQLRQTALQGANTVTTGATRQGLVTAAQNALQQLITLANSQDTSGRYIFAGTKADAAPFQNLSNGQVVFSGDDGTNVIEIAPSLSVPVTASGLSIFTNVRLGTDGVAVSAVQANVGQATAVIQGVTSVSQVAAERLAGTQFEISFSTLAGGGLGYAVTSGSGSPGSANFSSTSGVVASGTFAAGSDLLFGGIDLKVDGTPAAGDQFVVQPGATSSVFQIAQDLISALQTPPQQGQATTPYTQQQIQNTIANLDGAQTAIASAEASLGSGLAEIRAVQGQDSAQSTDAQAQLSNLQSANFPEVLSNYSAAVTALQAAEEAFSRIQNLTLFSVLH